MIKFCIILWTCFVFCTSYDACPRISPNVVLGDSLNRFYHFQLFDKLNFYRAFQYCNYIGMRLLTPQKKEEEEFVVEMVKKSGMNVSFWSSLTSLQRPGHFKWMTTGRYVGDDSDLWSRHPRDDSETCTILDNNTDWKHTTVDCTRDEYFICEDIVC